MSRDWSLEGLGKGDGVLTRDELELIISQQERRFTATSAAGDRAMLNESRSLLQEMRLAGVDAVTYLPEDLQGVLPNGLKARATELLMLSYDPQIDARRINQEVIDRARANYRGLGGMPAWAAITSRTRALEEIDQIANLLGLH